MAGCGRTFGWLSSRYQPNGHLIQRTAVSINSIRGHWCPRAPPLDDLDKLFVHTRVNILCSRTINSYILLSESCMNISPSECSLKQRKRNIVSRMRCCDICWTSYFRRRNRLTSDTMVMYPWEHDLLLHPTNTALSKVVFTCTPSSTCSSNSRAKSLSPNRSAVGICINCATLAVSVEFWQVNESYTASV